MISWFYWDPPRELFTLPILHWPIMWYSILFATGFVFGYFILSALLRRFFLLYPILQKKELVQEAELVAYFNDPKSLFHKKVRDAQSAIDAMNRCIEDQASFEKLEKACNKEKFYQDIRDKARFLRNRQYEKACVRLYFDRVVPDAITSIKEKARLIIDHLSIYVVLGTIFGARIGHFLFYEHPSRYLRDPISVLKVWEGGLASHGAILGIIISLILFRLWSRKIAPNLTFTSMLDLLCIPTALAGCFIRLGNFFNQEISGTVTDAPWAVIFGHPFDGSIPAPRHPVQIYEALFYLFTFFCLWFLSRSYAIFSKKGRLIGLFFLIVFTFRFFVEFYKEEQSALLIGNSHLTMGQILSVPVVLVGIIFFFMPVFSKKT